MKSLCYQFLAPQNLCFVYLQLIVVHIAITLWTPTQKTSGLAALYYKEKLFNTKIQWNIVQDLSKTWRVFAIPLINCYLLWQW